MWWIRFSRGRQKSNLFSSAQIKVLTLLLCKDLNWEECLFFPRSVLNCNCLEWGVTNVGAGHTFIVKKFAVLGSQKAVERAFIKEIQDVRESRWQVAKFFNNVFLLL